MKQKLTIKPIKTIFFMPTLFTDKQNKLFTKTELDTIASINQSIWLLRHLAESKHGTQGTAKKKALKNKLLAIIQKQLP